jgi:histone H3/H4
MENITNPSIVRLSRKAGVKSMSNECYNTIRKIAQQELDEIVKTMLIVNSEHNTKTIMQEDIYDALKLRGHYVAQSQELSS